jgi:hypothetical protein
VTPVVPVSIAQVVQKVTEIVAEKINRPSLTQV